MVPSWNFTVRPALFEAAPVAAARADAFDSAAIIALTAGSDEPSAAQNLLNPRLLNNFLFISSTQENVVQILTATEFNSYGQVFNHLSSLQIFNRPIPRMNAIAV
jgi:hypothetical protein